MTDDIIEWRGERWEFEARVLNQYKPGEFITFRKLPKENPMPPLIPYMSVVINGSFRIVTCIGRGLPLYSGTTFDCVDQFGESSVCSTTQVTQIWRNGKCIWRGEG